VESHRVRRIGRICKRYAGLPASDFSNKTLTELIKRSYSDGAALQELRQYLATGMSLSWAVRGAAYAELMDLSEWVHMTKRELIHVEVQLRATQEGIYSDVDRHRAEADFRTGIAAPVGVLGGMATAYVAYLLDPSLNGGVLFVMSVPAGTVLAAALYFQGYRKEEEAKRLLVSSLQTALVNETELGFRDSRLIRISKDATFLTDEGRAEIRKLFLRMRHAMPVFRKSRGNASNGVVPRRAADAGD